MSLTFAGTLDRTALVRATDACRDLVTDARTAARWEQESVLTGMTVGGLTRHLVSQPECAVEFLTAAQPAGAEVLSLLDGYARADWLDAPLDHPANTSIRDDFNAMAAGGQGHSRQILEASLAAMPAALAVAGTTTYVPWQDCALALDDFLAVRLLEIVVHADDLAASIDVAPPAFDDDVLHPAIALMAVLSLRRHGQDATLRGLSRAERSRGTISAF